MCCGTRRKGQCLSLSLARIRGGTTTDGQQLPKQEEDQVEKAFIYHCRQGDHPLCVGVFCFLRRSMDWNRSDVGGSHYLRLVDQ